MKCFYCHAAIPDNISKCPMCNLKYNNLDINMNNCRDINICNNCHSNLNNGDSHCDICGKDKLSDQELTLKSNNKLYNYTYANATNILIYSAIATIIISFAIEFENIIAINQTGVKFEFIFIILSACILFMKLYLPVIAIVYGIEKIYSYFDLHRLKDVLVTKAKIVDYKLIDYTLDICLYPILEYIVNNKKYRYLDLDSGILYKNGYKLPNIKDIKTKYKKLFYIADDPYDARVYTTDLKRGIVVIIIGMIFAIIFISNSMI